MTTSTENRISPSKVVTPIVSSSSGVAGSYREAKLGLPKNEEIWDEDIEQLAKYDDDFWVVTGKEKISSHDLVALVPLARAVKFAIGCNVV